MPVAATRSYSEQSCADLFAEILAHDAVHRGCALPPGARLDYDAHQLEGCFRLSHQLWRDGLDVPELRRIARAVLRAGRLEEADARRLKHVRARFKQLRFLFALVDARHRYPARLDRVTVSMGRMQDALRLGGGVAARGRALQLVLRLRAPAVARLVAECDAFAPATAASFRAHVADAMDGLAEIGGEARLSARRFHAARKIVSRLVALCDALKILYPGADIALTSRYLGTLNGLMGGLHDDLVARRGVRFGMARREPVALPAEIAGMTRAVARAFGGDAVTGPPQRRVREGRAESKVTP